MDIAGVWIQQPKLLTNLKANFIDLVEANTIVFKTKTVRRAIKNGRKRHHQIK
jgi:hypothetical protein